MGIEPTSPGLNPGILSQLNYGNPRRARWIYSTSTGCGLFRRQRALRIGKDRWASGAADMGLRKRESNPQHQTRVRRLSHGEQPPLRFGAITCKLRPIEIGVTNRIRTGTNAFTGRDAAVTS